MYINASGRKFAVYVEQDATLQALKLKVMDEMGIPPHHQQMSFAGKTLSDDNASLASFGIDSTSEVYIKIPNIYCYYFIIYLFIYIFILLFFL